MFSFQWCKRGSALGAIAPFSRKNLLFLKEHEDKNILFVLSYANFCPALKKCYCLSIMLKISIGAVTITHNKLFKEFFNHDLNHGSFVSLYSSFSPAQPLSFSILFGRLGSSIMQECGFRIREDTNSNDD